MGCRLDARGHFNEPHKGQSFGVGTLEVRNYLAGLHDPQLVDAELSQPEVKRWGLAASGLNAGAAATPTTARRACLDRPSHSIETAAAARRPTIGARSRP
jgi:hypothetical protein